MLSNESPVIQRLSVSITMRLQPQRRDKLAILLLSRGHSVQDTNSNIENRINGTRTAIEGTIETKGATTLSGTADTLTEAEVIVHMDGTTAATGMARTTRTKIIRIS